MMDRTVKMMESPVKMMDSPAQIVDSSVKMMDSPVKIVDSPVKMMDSPVKMMDSPPERAIMKQYMWIVPPATASWTFLMIVKYDAMVSLLILRNLIVIINRCEL
ncbi:hypothetical protein ACZ11_12550 [Lysinibacillus xylanilyticus]|uniref:Uncharacterized protein n=1 Tax=Lysinibacillus xylanilyticus TaxID=582475 RepID=A0A0K9FEH9_9BACI|nr:hypothetical protein [Lysinibacillus xylanilyticus]KMY32905.1 hypothetical protein ACZ11_12550 [Lysinibacillus xylanilyticus]